MFLYLVWVVVKVPWAKRDVPKVEQQHFKWNSKAPCIMCCFLIACVFCRCFCSTPFYPSVYKTTSEILQGFYQCILWFILSSKDDDCQRFFGFILSWICSLVIHLLSVSECRTVIKTLHIDLFDFSFSTSHGITAEEVATPPLHGTCSFSSQALISGTLLFYFGFFSYFRITNGIEG